MSEDSVSTGHGRVASTAAAAPAPLRSSRVRNPHVQGQTPDLAELDAASAEGAAGDTPTHAMIGAMGNDHEPIDLHHQGERVVGVYLVETEDGPALFDCGPTSTLDRLLQGLGDRGVRL